MMLPAPGNCNARRRTPGSSLDRRGHLGDDSSRADALARKYGAAMTGKRARGAGIATTVVLTAAAAAAESPATPYQPLAFLIGHCWIGTFPDGKVTDEHCFSWIYGGKFVRDEHIVRRGPGQPDGFGESIYLWDATSGQLQYLYIESDGGYSRGTVSAGAEALVFPPASYQERGQAQTYRGRWQRAGSDAYDVVTEFRVGEQWVPRFAVHMKQERN